jgi:hypothetical protein
MELVPRITRAQSMDVLSSQANLAGYRAVVDAASELPLIGCPSAAPCSSPFYAASPVSSLQYGPAWPPPWEATWRGAFFSRSLGRFLDGCGRSQSLKIVLGLILPQEK